MPKDQREKWREAKARYRAKQRTEGPEQPQEENHNPIDANYW